MNKEAAQLLPTCYRQSVIDHEGDELAGDWNKRFRDRPSLWEHIRLEQGCDFVLRLENGQQVALSSVDPVRLHPGVSQLGWLGKLVAKLSLGARILAGRKGTEEVTFYCLLNQPHGRSVLERWVDRVVLNMVAPPLNWRRLIVLRTLRSRLSRALRQGNQESTLLDIGCGGGFDGLDLLMKLDSSQSGSKLLPRFKIVNVDIDSLWLGNNAAIAEAAAIAPGAITRRNISIFDYLEAETWCQDLPGSGQLLISCNGFADFLPPDGLSRLLAGVALLCDRHNGEICLILPLAIRNTLQGIASRLVGFGYTGWDVVALRQIITQHFSGFSIHYEQNYSQGVFLLERPARS